MLQDNFVANVLSAMSAAGMSQRQLAEKSGVHFVTVNRVLRGNQDPTLEVCEKLAAAVKLAPSIIFANSQKKR